MLPHLNAPYAKKLFDHCQPENFLLASLISLGIALFSISDHVLKAAWTEPAKALKYE